MGKRQPQEKLKREREIMSVKERAGLLGNPVAEEPHTVFTVGH